MAKAERRGGQYRQMLLQQSGHMPETEEPVSFFRIKFYICLSLFICYVLLDYTKFSVYSFDSSRIYAAIGEDMTADFDLEETFAQVMDSIWVSDDAKDEAVETEK